ncbi:MAG TPA: hypothetical protein VGF24_29385 [Vicinamibacterales bacterium]
MGQQIDIREFQQAITAALAKDEAGFVKEEGKLNTLTRTVHNDMATGRISQAQADEYIQRKIDPALARVRWYRQQARVAMSRDPRIAAMKSRIEAELSDARSAVHRLEQQRREFFDGLHRLGVPSEPVVLEQPRQLETAYEPVLS